MAVVEDHPESRSRRLKILTETTHDHLDRSIISAASFTSLAGYGRFVGVQYLFHRDIRGLYADAALARWLPNLGERARFDLIDADLRDLGIDPPSPVAPPVFADGAMHDGATALGWLYVAEGSNLGAAILRKEAAKIGLSDTYGARHLAPAIDGPAAAWRRFTAGLDAVDLTEEEEARVGAGAQAAFARVQHYADTLLA